METHHKFEAVAKKPDGYQIPDGPIVSWNDICEVIERNWGIPKKVDFRKFDGVDKDNKCLYWFDHTGSTELTALGESVENFSEALNTAMVDGRMALFQRDGFSHSFSPQQVPNKLNEKNTYGYLLSLTELKHELQAFIYRNDGNEKRMLGAQQLDNLLKIVESELVDYSDTNVAPINAPVPKHKLKNTLDDVLNQKKTYIQNDLAMKILKDFR